MPLSEEQIAEFVQIVDTNNDGMVDCKLRTLSARLSRPINGSLITPTPTTNLLSKIAVANESRREVAERDVSLIACHSTRGASDRYPLGW